jgi:hypothetical protein
VVATPGPGTRIFNGFDLDLNFLGGGVRQQFFGKPIFLWPAPVNT